MDVKYYFIFSLNDSIENYESTFNGIISDLCDSGFVLERGSVLYGKPNSPSSVVNYIISIQKIIQKYGKDTFTSFKMLRTTDDVDFLDYDFPIIDQ